MSESERLRQRQFAFAAHLRDARNPPPPGIEERRLAIYRELFHNTIEGLLASNFPVMQKTLGDADWDALVRRFHRQHRCQTPLFTEVAEEFIGWLAADPTLTPEWLPELAHYEWMELRADIDDTPAPAHAHDGDLLAGMPVLSAQAWPLAYAWPVDRIGPQFQPASAPNEPTLLLVRRDRDNTIHFAKLSALSFRLLQLIEANDSASGDALIAQLAIEAGLPGDADFIAEARAMLQRLHDEGTVIGTRIG
ncbi:MAG: putative DNA-binding domain-containing protein [Pseudomonadota bacterium]|nr:putative DNA-binding domain-containing protein [Pseudomonadota bacterium]